MLKEDLMHLVNTQTETNQAQRDALDAYFRCIAECSIDDGECTIRCVEAHLKGATTEEKT